MLNSTRPATSRARLSTSDGRIWRWSGRGCTVMPPAPARMAVSAAWSTRGSSPPRELRSTATLLTFTLSTVMRPAYPARRPAEKRRPARSAPPGLVDNPYMRPGRFLTAGLLAFCLLLTPTPRVAGAIPGPPLKQSFGVGETKVTPGHLALATGPNGELFVGNVEGVLIYDGVTWSTAELTGLSPARALALGADGRIYVGGYDTFGRLARNGEGRYVYEELLGQAGLRDAQRHGGIGWGLLARPEGVYCRAEGNLHFLP